MDVERVHDDSHLFAANLGCYDSGELADHDSPGWGYAFHRGKLDVVLTVGDGDAESKRPRNNFGETAVRESDEARYLAGLRDRLDDVDSGAAAELRADIEDLEDDIEDLVTQD